MSLAVLAKKSKQYTNRVSGCGLNGFSLNGGYRNQGWVGQDMLGRTLIGTRFRGTQPLGHGGKNGTYTTTVINRCRPCTNDPNIIKRSNMNTAGYISDRLVPRGAPCEEGVHTRCKPIWVQKFDPDDHAQGEYIKRLAAMVASTNWPKSGGTAEPYAATAGPNTCEGTTCKAASYFIGTRKVYRTVFSKSLPIFPLTCGEYTRSRLMIVRHLPTPPCAAPWPPPMARDAQCKRTYVTPQEGYRAGLLPPDWTNGGRMKLLGDGSAASTTGAVSESTREWARSLFGSQTRYECDPREGCIRDPQADCATSCGTSFPPPAPVPYLPPDSQEIHFRCKRREMIKNNNIYYKPGSGNSVGVGGSCNPGTIGARARRLGGKLKPIPTVIFRNVPKT